MRGRIWWVAILVSLVGRPTSADDFVLAGEVFGTYNTFAMKQVNDDFARFNQTGSSQFERIEKSVAGGLGVRFWLTPTWLITAAWEPLYGQTESIVFAADSSGAPFFVDVRYNVDASSVQMGAAYFFPSAKPIRFGLGGGVGYYWLDGEAVIEHQTGVATGENFQSADKLTGNAPGFHVTGLAEWTLSPGFAATALAGYRYAKVKDTLFSGVSDSPKAVTDYSGFMGRLGIALYLPMR